ncbi:MAG: GUN4 domain-containing protein, partial [Vulcanococcus sp.]
LLAACGNDWTRLWPRLGWKREGTWTRYPGGFTWSLQAPEGHLPLVNQLRGVRLMDSLLRHPALAARIAGPAAVAG